MSELSYWPQKSTPVLNCSQNINATAVILRWTSHCSLLLIETVGLSKNGFKTQWGKVGEVLTTLWWPYKTESLMCKMYEKVKTFPEDSQFLKPAACMPSHSHWSFKTNETQPWSNPCLSMFITEKNPAFSQIKLSLLLSTCPSCCWSHFHSWRHMKVKSYI